MRNLLDRSRADGPRSAFQTVQLAGQRAKRLVAVDTLELQDQRIDRSSSLGQLNTEYGVQPLEPRS